MVKAHFGRSIPIKLSIFSDWERNLKPLNIILAPDSFKGSLSAVDFCRISESVIEKKMPGSKVLSLPLSDGGEGFVESFVYAGKAEAVSLWVSDPVGRKTKAKYGWQEASKTALIEMAQASGLPKLRPEERNPMQVHTYGTGQLIQAALNKGAKRIVLGLGGSATNDGGMGALNALGIAFYDTQNKALGLGGQFLSKIDRIGEIPQHLTEIDWVMACDVTNPLLGENGATAVFGPQKGVNLQNQRLLENGLEKFALKIQDLTSNDVIDVPGAGAAGGMAAGFMGLLNARIVPGFELLKQELNLDMQFDSFAADLLITGEGRIDRQSLSGKLPVRVAELGKGYQTPVIGLCGSLGEGVQEFLEASSFDALFSIVNRPMEEVQAFSETPQLLAEALENILSLMSVAVNRAGQDR